MSTPTAEEHQTKHHDDRPLTFKLANWWGFIFAGMYLLYGVVKIILSFLDRNYDSMASPIGFAIIGAILMGLAYGFRESKKWGWFGLIGINGLVVILSIINVTRFEYAVLLVISAGALYALFAPQTKAYLASHG